MVFRIENAGFKISGNKLMFYFDSLSGNLSISDGKNSTKFHISLLEELIEGLIFVVEHQKKLMDNDEVYTKSEKLETVIETVKNEIIESDDENFITLEDLYYNCELDARTYNCLISGGILSIECLKDKTVSDLLKIQNFGKKSLLRLSDCFRERGLDINEILKK